MLIFIKVDIRLKFGSFILTIIADFSIFVLKNDPVLVIFKKFIRTPPQFPARE